jgi:hypothetical protein
MKKMNKSIYLGIYQASLGFAIITISAGIFAGKMIKQSLQGSGFSPSGADSFHAQVVIFAAIQLLLVHIIYQFVILAKMWASIDDGRSGVNPVSAIAFLFIPFFNLYWIFKVWKGFPQAFGDYGERHKLSTSYLGSNAFSLYPIFAILSLIPYLGVIFGVMNFFVFHQIISVTCDAVNKLGIAELNLAQSQMKQVSAIEPFMVGA